MRPRLFQADPNRTQIVEIVGRLDNAHAASLTEHAENALAHGRPHLILDMSAVTFISSAGLRALVQIVKRTAAAGGSLTIVNPSEPVERVLELVGLDTVFRITFDPQWNPLQPGAPGITRQMCVLP
ncbi:MAG: STAS domain-containing protein [Anaerolineae bacterium]|nr:STAS domain-containing protein [Anaerolineae bacterium]